MIRKNISSQKFPKKVNTATDHLDEYIIERYMLATRMDEYSTDSLIAKQGPDVHQRKKRQQQLQYGYNTEGYKRYIGLLEKRYVKKTCDDPREPLVDAYCSKRSFDGQIKTWRRELHAFDDPDIDIKRARALIRDMRSVRNYAKRSESDSSSTTSDASSILSDMCESDDSGCSSFSFGDHTENKSWADMCEEETSMLPPLCVDVIDFF